MTESIYGSRRKQILGLMSERRVSQIVVTMSLMSINFIVLGSLPPSSSTPYFIPGTPGVLPINSPDSSLRHLLPHPSVSTLLILPITSTPSNSCLLLPPSLAFPLSASSISILLLSRLRLLGAS